VNAVTSQPNFPFYIIVNPNSGPGNKAQPIKAYQTCVPQFKQPNVKVIGYVSTQNGNRAQADVTADVNTYARWGAAYVPDGIFFDEVSGKAKQLSLYTTYASLAKQSFSGGNGFVTLNPGTMPMTWPILALPIWS